MLTIKICNLHLNSLCWKDTEYHFEYISKSKFKKKTVLTLCGELNESDYNGFKDNQ